MYNLMVLDEVVLVCFYSDECAVTVIFAVFCSQYFSKDLRFDLRFALKRF